TLCASSTRATRSRSFWSSRTPSTRSSSPIAATSWSTAGSRSPAPAPSCSSARTSRRPTWKEAGTDGRSLRGGLVRRLSAGHRPARRRHRFARRPRHRAHLAAVVEPHPLHADPRRRDPLLPRDAVQRDGPVAALLRGRYLHRPRVRRPRVPSHPPGADAAAVRGPRHDRCALAHAARLRVLIYRLPAPWILPPFSRIKSAHQGGPATTGAQTRGDPH